MRESIQFTGLYEGQSYELETHESEYRNLMALLKDKVCPDYFGQCGGMGRCRTCLVKFSADTEIQLSCQLLVNNTLQDAVIELIGDM